VFIFCTPLHTGVISFVWVNLYSLGNVTTAAINAFTLVPWYLTHLWVLLLDRVTAEPVSLTKL